MNKQQKLKYLNLANQSLVHFALAFFPEAFKDPFCPDIHYPMVRTIEAPGWRMKAVAAPRGCGKSTLGNTVNLVRRAAMGLNNYILIVSHTEEQAIEHLKVIKKQFTENEKIIEIFGDLQGATWKENEAVLANGVKIKALGTGQQVRGRREGFDRPDYALLDDFESPDSVNSEVTLARIRAWWSSDLRNSLDRHRGEELLLGTVLSDASILEDQLNNDACLSVRLQLFDEFYKSVWPEVYSDARINEMRLQAESEGTLDQLSADYRNVAVAGENRKFDPAWFKFWHAGPDGRPVGWEQLPRYLIVDPAKTTARTSDYAALHAVGLPWTGDVYDLEYAMDRKVNEALYELAYQMCVKWQINQLYVETNGLEDYIVEPLANYIRKKGHPCMVTGIHASITLGSKNDRIAGLIPLYFLGQVYHSPFHYVELEGQLIKFPKSKFDDLMDCLAYVTYIQTKRFLGRTPTETSVYEGNDRMLGRRIV